MELIQIPFFIGWASMLFGILSGAYLGLNFHDEQWEGGYSSYRRRLWRLGHIAFFGIGFVNIFSGVTMPHFGYSELNHLLIVSGLIVVTISMPLVCFLSGWKKVFRHLFPVPVIGLSVAVITMLYGMI